jgi:formylglycine-generating enzyme required for sulfatase activity
VLRGGALNFDANFVRCAYRVSGDPDFRLNVPGFRVVVSPFFSNDENSGFWYSV